MDPTIGPKTPTESEEPTGDEDSIANGQINAIVDTESEITVEYVNDPTTDTATNTAEVVFLGGCVSSEKKLAEGRDLKFRVEPAAGRVVSKVEVKTVDGETETAASVTEAGGIYTVAKSAFVKGSGDNATALNGKIIVTTKAVTYKVSFNGDASVAGSYKVYPVEAKSAEDTTEVLGAEITGAATTDVAYGKSAKFALVLTANGDVVENKLDSITLNGEAITTTAAELNKKDDAAGADKTKCVTFTVDPSKAGNLGDATTDNTEAEVSVKVVAKAKLTVEFDSENANSTVGASTTNTAETFINYSGTAFGTDSTFVEDDATNLAKSLAFKVTPAANYKVTDVTAKAATASDEEGTAVTVAKGTPAANDGSVECTIALSGVGSFSENTNLTISIAVALDDTKDSVHTINFKDKDGNAPAHVAITHGADSADGELEGSSLTVTGDTYKISVAPAAGYELPKGGDDDDVALKDKQYVTITENRKYESKTTAGTYDDAKTYTHKEDISAAITLTLADTTTGDTNYEADATDNRKFITTSVDVEINAAVLKNDGEKIVHFDDQLGAGYAITADGVIHDEEAVDEDNTWVIPASVDVLSFTVTSARKPAVTVGGVETKGTAAENVYTFTVPAMALTDPTTEIVIDAADALTQKAIKVKVVADDVTVKSVYNDSEVTENLSSEDDGYYTLSVAPEEGSDLTLSFLPKPGVTINKVSYTMGETTGEATPDRKGNVDLTLTVTDDLTVDVESKSDYRVKLFNANGELDQDGDAYVADYTDTNIDIELTKAGVTYSQNLYDVVVKDGAKTAATEATVNGATARIASIDKTERGKDLTIEVYINKSTKYTTTLKTNAVSDEVTVSRTVNGKDIKVAEDATVEIMPDAAMAFTVTPAKGASLSDLDVEILAKDGTALAAASTPIEDVDFTDGTLTVQTKPGAAKDTEVLVSIYNKNEEKAAGVTANTALKGGKFVLKLTDSLVKTAEVKSVTAVAGSGTNRAVRLNVNVDFKNKKNPPAAPIQGDLYYKIELTAPTGAPAGVTVISGADLVKYVKVDDFANPATTLTIPLVVSNSADVNGAEADIAEIISTTAKVTLVQSLKETPAAEADYVAGPEAVMKDNTLSTKAPIYETKLTVKSVNGATVFTGQTDAKVATPVFGKTTAYDNISVQFVDTKTGVRYGSSYRGFTTRVDTDNSILVSAADYIKVNNSTYKDMLKTFGVKVTAVAPDESYAASAVVKLKVQQGIYDVDVDESKAKLPETIFKDPKKAASVKITPLLNGGIKDYKPAKATVTWAIDVAGDNDSTYAAAALTGSKPLVSVKNGTVSIAKDYQVQAEESDNRFTVTITPADFIGNTATPMEVTFEITDQKNEIGKLVVLDYDGNVKDPASLTAEEFDYWDHNNNDGSDDYTKYLYVAALKKGVKEADRYTNDEDFLPVTFKSGNAKALAVDTASGLLTFSKPADKIKITATTVDGGKAPKSELVINVKPYKQVGLSITGVDDSRSGLDQTDIHYSGGNNERYDLWPHYSTENGWRGISDYKNLKITVKGGKFIANKNWAKLRGNRMGYAVVVTDKSGKATITVTDTANKDKNTNHKDYTITNDSFTAAKAPSIKLYEAWGYDAKTGEWVKQKKIDAYTEDITWQVTDKNNDNYAGSYVKLTPDFTVTTSNPAYSLVGDTGTILKIDENGRFGMENLGLSGGNYKIIATVGTMIGGEFVASAKDAKISFNIPVKKWKTNLTVKGSYTLDAKGASYAVIDVKSDYNYEIFSAMNVIKKEQGKDDHTNRFTEFFEVNPLTYESNNIEYVYAYTIGLKSGLSAEQIEYITSRDGKDDCTGYITVSNGTGRMGSLSGRYNTKDVQVKISFKENKYSLTGATIFSNGTATTPVTATVRLMNGKVRDYAALVAVDATDDGRFAAATNALSFNDGDIVITSKAAAIEPGKYDVKLIVVPQNSSFVKWDETTQKWVYANDKTENGKVLTEAELIAKAGIPVTAKIDVKAVDTKNIAKAKNLNVTLRTDDDDIYVGPNDSYGNGYVQATPTKGGYYQVDVPYSIAINGSDIAATADSVKVNLTDKAGVDQNKITVAANTTEDLVKAAKAVGNDDDGNEIPVIRLQVSKKALVALTNMPKADKPITGYGKKLKVPVEIKYTNGITTTDTLNFNITMPKNAPADFAAVQKTIADNKAAIEKIQTKLYSYSSDVLDGLFADVHRKVCDLVPADTDVKVNDTLDKKHLNDGEDVAQAEETDTPDYDGIMSAGKAKITLTLTDVSKATGNTADVSWNYTLGMNAESSDVTDAVSAIESATLTYTNETTAASLLAEIKADEGVKPYLDTRKGHLSLKVADFYKSPATIKGTGTVTAEIQVKDLVTGDSNTAYVGSEDNIPQLSTLTDAKTAVTELFDTAAEVLAYVDDCSGQEAVMKEAILKAANDAAANKDITIAFKTDTATKKGWDYKPAKAAVTNGDTTTPAEDGSLSFTLVLTKKQADGSRSAEITSATATIDKADVEKYVSLTDVKTKIAAEVADGTEYTKLKAVVASASPANNANAIKTAIADALDTEVAKYKGYSWAWAKTADNKEDFTYTAATQSGKGKLSFQIVLTLKGAKDAGLTTGVTETISVTNAEVVDAADAYQTAEELKAKIEAIGTTAAPITAAAVPTDKTGANTALVAEIAKVNKATPAITVTAGDADALEEGGTTPTTYTTSPSGEGVTPTKGEYKNVKITIGTGDNEIVFTHDFNFAVTPATGG